MLLILSTNWLFNITFLGHEDSSGGLCVDPWKFQAVSEWGSPSPIPASAVFLTHSQRQADRQAAARGGKQHEAALLQSARLTQTTRESSLSARAGKIRSTPH
ncbi:hypothetical protein DNTS_033091 [Danionella cerebrum]|uniref:Uncharacterized protein n=1 Tax=Danionella cerebrum TaxID=2873325 RepID=A0A553N5S7_9TELE|nr:hypothetical protein DNTS_033091 [Danionella translucida]